MIFYDLECPIHYRPFVSVEDQPELKCKCPYKACDLVVYASDDTNAIVDRRFVDAPVSVEALN